MILIKDKNRRLEILQLIGYAGNYEISEGADRNRNNVRLAGD
jgi:hypothetical protein